MRKNIYEEYLVILNCLFKKTCTDYRYSNLTIKSQTTRGTLFAWLYIGYVSVGAILKHILNEQVLC